MIPRACGTWWRKLNKDRDRYARDTETILKDAQAKEADSDTQELRAARFDLGEGFLELGLVLSSLYFLAKRPFFPVLGAVAAVIGTALGIAVFLGEVALASRLCPPLNP